MSQLFRQDIKSMTLVTYGVVDCMLADYGKKNMTCLLQMPQIILRVIQKSFSNTVMISFCIVNNFH
jgi:hypothetical protein